MTKKQSNKINNISFANFRRIFIQYLQRNIIFVFIFLILLITDLLTFNYDYLIYHFHNLKEVTYEIKEATKLGFEFHDGALIPQHDDPNITFPDIDQPVRYIGLSCSNSETEAFSQIYFPGWIQGFNESNSVVFSLSPSDEIITIPRTVRLSNLRFDLTNLEQDIVYCQNITVNPVRTFNFSYIRFALILLSIFGLLFGEKIISENASNKVWNLMIKNGMLFFILLLIIINSAYPLTLTYDSGHYLWLSNLIKNGNWINWDPFRNVGFPLKIFLSTAYFGYRQEAILIPMLLAHILLFVFSCLIVLEIIQPTSQKSRFFIVLFVFIFIALDPTIVGYFHTLLTEYFAATIAICSSYFAIMLYKAPLFSKKFYFILSFFIVMVPISWHIKQDYVGTALFPLLIYFFLNILRNYSLKNAVFSCLFVGLLISIILFSTLIWNNFIQSQNNPMIEERDLSLMIESSLGTQVASFQKGPSEFIKAQLEKYFIIINFHNQENHQPLDEYSLTYGFQNRIIAHRMYLNPYQENIIYESPSFDPYIDPFTTRYAARNRMNFLFHERIVVSHFLFTFSYMVLPILVLIVFILWISKKLFVNAALLILSGTSLLNALIHLLTGPIDRYLFPGYPLNLVIITILILLLIRSIRNKKQSTNGTIL